jgi:DNA-binding transcriptional LysR family regulator
MELRMISSFIKVAELNSFSKAADVLGYTQSNVTMQIKQLETELGTNLFDRIGKNISLTESGRKFLRYATEVITSIDNAKQALCSNQLPTGELRIGLLESLCITYLPQVINDYHQKYPEVNTIIKIGTFEELSVMLNANLIDLLWTFDYPMKNEQWIKEYDYPEKISIIAAPTHRLCQAERVQLCSFTNETFIFTESNCSYRNAFQEKLTAAGIPFATFMEIGNTEIIKRFVSSGLCLSVLPQFTIKNELESGQIRTISTAEFDLTMYGQVFYHKNKWVTPAMREFILLLQNYIG